MDTITEPAATSKTSRPRRRWFQFSLRTLIIFTLVVSVVAAWFGNTYYRVQQQRRIVKLIESKKGTVVYDYQYLARSAFQRPTPPGSPLIRWMFGDDVSATVETVIFNGSNAKDADLDLLADLPQLKRVLLTRFTGLALDKLAKCEQLTEISVGDVPLDSQGMKSLESIRGLTHFHLTGDAYDDQSIAGISRLKRLEVLQLMGTRITSRGLAELCRLKELMRLDIWQGASIDNEGVQHLAKLRKLQSLMLHTTGVTDAGLHHLAGLQELVELTLIGNAITDAGIKPLTKLPKLTKLKLTECKVGDVAIAILANSNLKLESLEINDTQITDAAINEIVKFKHLRSLVLRGTKVTSEGIKKLETSQKLEFLYIDKAIDPKTIEFLKKKLPNCQTQTTF